MIFIGIIAVLAVIDLIIKKTIEEQEEHDFPRELKGTKGKVILYKNHNPGFSFGVLKGKPELVLVIPLMIASGLVGILCWLLPRRGYGIEKAALSITLGGAVSNLYDRIVRRYVVDYFSIEWRFLKNVVFNLGDICIFLGTGMILAVEFVRSVKEGQSCKKASKALY